MIMDFGISRRQWEVLQLLPGQQGVGHVPPGAPADHPGFPYQAPLAPEAALRRDKRLLETEANDLLGYVAPIPEEERVPGAEAVHDPPRRVHLADALMDVLPHPSEPGIGPVESLERAVRLDECIVQVLTWSLARATQRDLYH